MLSALFLYFLFIWSYCLQNFLTLFCYKHNNLTWLICTYCCTRKNSWHVPQGLIIRKLISQYASYSAMFCLLHSTICKEQHKRHPCTLSSYYKKYGKYVRETCSPRINYWTPISQYALYSAMFGLLHSNIRKEQHEKHLCNPSSHHWKYGEHACKMCALYLDTWEP